MIKTKQVSNPCPDGLLCAIALDPSSLPRNRYYWVYTDSRARRAHGRAHALRRLCSQVIELLRRDAKSVLIVQEGAGLRISYRDDSLSLHRRVHLGSLEASLLRWLICRADVVVPASLRLRGGDTPRVAAALERLRGWPGVGDNENVPIL